MVHVPTITSGSTLRLPRFPPDASVYDTRTVYGWTCRRLLPLLPQVSAPGRQAAENRLQDLAMEIVTLAEEADRQLPHVRHRALEDARRLWQVRRTILDEVTRHVQQAGI